MKKLIPVANIMTTSVVSLTTEDTLDLAESLFKEHNIRHIPVVQDTKILGMLSYTDLLRISFADAIGEDEQDIDSIVYNMFTIEQVMTKNLETISPDSTIKNVAEILAKREFHALPVIEKDKLVGIVTSTDLINYLLEQL